MPSEGRRSARSRRYAHRHQEADAVDNPGEHRPARALFALGDVALPAPPVDEGSTQCTDEHLSALAQAAWSPSGLWWRDNRPQESTESAFSWVDRRGRGATAPRAHRGIASSWFRGWPEPHIRESLRGRQTGTATGIGRAVGSAARRCDRYGVESVRRAAHRATLTIPSSSLPQRILWERDSSRVWQTRRKHHWSDY